VSTKVVGVHSVATPIESLGLREDELTRLSGILLRETGGHIAPTAVSWCETVGDLAFLVERLINR